jgi:phosphoribosylformylglycinamidine synthase
MDFCFGRFLWSSQSKGVVMRPAINRKYTDLTYIKGIANWWTGVAIRNGSMDWLTNKVESLCGCVANNKLQVHYNCHGFPLWCNGFRYNGRKWRDRSLSIAAIMDPVAGSRTAITRSLIKRVWAPIKGRFRQYFPISKLDVGL